MKFLKRLRRRKPERVIVIRDRGSLSNEERLLAYKCRRNTRRVQPALQFDIPIYKPE